MQKFPADLVFCELFGHSCQYILLHLLLCALDVNRDSVPLALRLLESSQLRLDHGALHVVGLALADALHEDGFSQLQVDEVDLDGWGAVGGNAHDIAVFALQRGTSDDNAGGWVEVVGFGRGEKVGGCLAEGDEPVPAVSVCKGDAVAHFVLVGFGVVLSVKG